MIRRALVVLGGVCVVYAVWHTVMTRSTTIPLASTGYELTYSMAWGWGMEERLSLQEPGALWPAQSSKWIEIWERPYNSGMVVYVSDDGQTYYFGTGYSLYFFEPSRSALWTTCDKDDIPKRTPFAERLSQYGSDPANEDVDPGAPRLLQYIQPNEASGTIPTSPLPSRYYAGLRYLGKFGLVAPDGRGRGRGRGDEVRFVPAGNSPEPRLGLQVSCG